MNIKKLIILIVFIGIFIYIIIPKRSSLIRNGENIIPSGYTCPCVGLTLENKSTINTIITTEKKCVGIILPSFFCGIVK